MFGNLGWVCSLPHCTQKSCIHYLNSNPEEVKKIVENAVKEILSSNRYYKELLNTKNDTVESFIKMKMTADNHIKSVKCESLNDYFSVIVIHDYSDTGNALNNIEPLLTSIEDKFDDIDFDFSVIHISNSTSNIASSSE